MKLTVLEDCSPYYIRLTHDGIDDIIKKCLEYSDGVNFKKFPFYHHLYRLGQADEILNLVPVAKDLKLNPGRVSLFVTQPGYYYRPHKDGVNHRVSLNYTIKILDNKCVTSWYDDESLKSYPIDLLGGRSREVDGFVKDKHTPLKSMTAIQGECILFNTEIFHDFDNSISTNERMVLTLRSKDPGSLYFDDARKILGV